MPSYFYHLKFELYAHPGPRTSREKREGRREGDRGRLNKVWIPPRGTDIFGSNWTTKRDRERGKTEEAEGGRTGIEAADTGVLRDWRFGSVRIEAVDMPPLPPPPAPSVGLPADAAGRVTKAEFRAIQTGSADVGWGVVRLYRDGEESPWLGTDLDLRNDDDDKKGDEGGKKEKEEDCTTLCIPAVPSYLTPSDFLGFVGEKTRAMVSHFRMVMTGRMNRYLVLMKFRDGQEARRWRTEWDGRVFNSMEVSLFIYAILICKSSSDTNSLRRAMSSSSSRSPSRRPRPIRTPASLSSPTTHSRRPPPAS